MNFGESLKSFNEGMQDIHEEKDTLRMARTCTRNAIVNGPSIELKTDEIVPRQRLRCRSLPARSSI